MPTVTVLTKPRYTALLRDITQLVSQASSAVDQQKVSAHWNLGRRIAREQLDVANGYRIAVLRDLAADARLSLRNLQYALAFHAAYPSCPKLPLSWLHFRTLS